MSDYPEHDKLKETTSERQAVGEFIEWLSENGYRICIYSPISEQFMPIVYSIDTWLADFFEIDLGKFDEEKRQMLEKIREEK